MTRPWGVPGCLLMLALGAADVAAQNVPVLRPRDITVAAGGVFTTSYAVGDRLAELRRNTAAPASNLTLFRAESTLERAAGLDVRVGVALTPTIVVEVGASYARPALGVAITGDSEAGGPVAIAGAVQQYTVDVSGIVQLPWRPLGRRVGPYVVGGGGYLRQLHDERLMVETGRRVHGGGGLRYWLRGGTGRGRSLGVRAEARYVQRTGGIEFDDRSRGYAAASVLLFGGF